MLATIFIFSVKVDTVEIPWYSSGELIVFRSLEYVDHLMALFSLAIICTPTSVIVTVFRRPCKISNILEIG